MIVIDRIEGDIVVIERDGSCEDVPLASIRGDARDGALLREVSPGIFEVSEDATSARAARIAEKASRLFRG